MSDINVITLSGVLGANPKIVSEKLVTIDIASKATSTNGTERTEKTTWFEVKLFNGFGQMLAKKLAQGDRVTVSGPVEMREVEKDGSKRRYYSILARDLDGEARFRTDEQGAARQAEKAGVAATPVQESADRIEVGETVDAAVAEAVAEAPVAAAAVADDDIPF